MLFSALRRIRPRFGRLAFALLIVIGLVTGSPAAVDQAANLALGQFDFTRGGINYVAAPSAAGPNGANAPGGIAIDRSTRTNRVYVADTLNNRVLAWNDAIALANGDPPVMVIGQPDFASSLCNGGAAV